MQRFALLGAGFWASYQLAAWGEIPGATCAVVCDPDREKAERLAARFGVPRVAADPEEALRDVDFVDIVTPPATHPELVRRCLAQRLPTVCQKPLAEDPETAEALVREADDARVPLLVHENWRWQIPIRALKAEVDSGVIGGLFRARLTMVSGFPVFANQPFLKTLERFLLADIGVHVLDTARLLFGEADSVYCVTRKVQADIAGEDAATVVTRHGGVTVVTELGYVQNHYERDRFPETFAFVEGTKGSIELAPDFRLAVTTATGTRSRRVPPPRYEWANPDYAVVHSSMVPCLRDLLSGVTGGPSENTAAQNLKTLRLVFAAYESAANNRVVALV
ncbi:MAG: Gfo/Idh/MocA family oxidoreductase [Capsulimonadales bacterium]|nr:Gfo/Idh/MocA family oxidoreductase [Capsulimonadales bacterium]